MVASDSALLDACPDFVSVGSLLKAHPQEDGGRRYVFLEASNEGLDQQGEVVLSKALADSKDFYLRYGNLDIDHYTQIGPRLGIPDYPSYEIGQPVDVGQRDGSTFVKSELYAAVGPNATSAMVDKADMVWDGLTKVRPAQRWFPSVGGSVLSKAIQVDPQTQARKAVVDRVRWTNIGLSKTPVNQHVAACETVPLGVFAKALTAGYGTDSAALEGGGAMRAQSLDPKIKNYWQFRDAMATAIATRQVNPRAADLCRHAQEQFGLSADDAAEHVERFMRHVREGLQQRKAS